MKTIASIGSIVIDLAVTTPRVPITGENILAHSFQMGPGGKGANAATALARAGARALLVGCVGNDDFGRFELAALKQYNVETEAVQIVEAGTAIAVIMVDDNHENTILVVMGASNLLTAERVEQALMPHRDTLDMLLIDFEIPEEAVAAAVQFGKQYHIPTLVDAGPPRTFAPATWKDCTIISPNALEAATLVGYPVENDEDALRACRDLLAQGPQAVVLKRGAAGSLLVTREETLHVPGFKVNAVDTTGAGDAFTATLAISYVEGRPLREAVLRGNAAGAIAVTRFGTMPAMPYQIEVEAFLVERAKEGQISG